MTKIKLTDLAKEFSLSPKELTDQLMKGGYKLLPRAHFVTEQQAAEIRGLWSDKRISLTETRKGDLLEKRVERGVIRRRKVQLEPETKPPAADQPPTSLPLLKKEKPSEQSVEKAEEKPVSPPPKAKPDFKKASKVKLVSPKEIMPVSANKPVIGKSGEAKRISEEQQTALDELAKKRKKAFIQKRAQEFDLTAFSRIERIYQPKKKKVVDKSKMKFTSMTTPKASKRIIQMEEQITVSSLASMLKIRVSDIIKKLMGMGTMVTANQVIDADTAVAVASEYGFTVKSESVSETQLLKRRAPRTENLILRPPVVTIMGHVDHGKTTLLDALRKTDVASGEAGGITQHIGAYMVHVGKNRMITFIDTPGHEAFSAMRARGAKTTDIVILVVAADDGIMPQTKEAIAHAKEAGVALMVAINKIDKPGAQVEKVKKGLADMELLPEDWGGKTVVAEVSAKTQKGLNELLELVLLQAEVLELKADPEMLAEGVVIEAHLTKGLGPVATILVQRGTLHQGDYVVMGTTWGKVRTLRDDQGSPFHQAGPSFAVEIAGLDKVPDVGECFFAFDQEEDAQQLVRFRCAKEKDKQQQPDQKITLEALYEKMKEASLNELKFVVKADVQGSVEVMKQTIEQLSTNQIKMNVIYASAGGITESDVNLAAASGAILIGFNIRPDSKAREPVKKFGVDLRLYTVIYDVVDDLKKAMLGLLKPTYKEKIIGRVEVRNIFHVSKVGTIAGCAVTEGKITRKSELRLIRDAKVIYTGKLASLKRFKNDAKEVQQGYECGLSIEGYNDLKEGDVIEAFEMEEVEKTL